MIFCMWFQVLSGRPFLAPKREHQSLPHIVDFSRVMFFFSRLDQTICQLDYFWGAFGDAGVVGGDDEGGLVFGAQVAEEVNDFVAGF
jgi:hypothetical protein